VKENRVPRRGLKESGQLSNNEENDVSRPLARHNLDILTSVPLRASAVRNLGKGEIEKCRDN